VPLSTITAGFIVSSNDFLPDADTFSVEVALVHAVSINKLNPNALIIIKMVFCVNEYMGK
jgi:hypothetical protein